MDGRVRFSETGEDRKLTLVGLMNYYQDCCTFHSEDVGISVFETSRQHLAWLVNYWQIDIEQMPKLGDKIRTITNPYDCRGFLAWRNLEMLSWEGEILSRGYSLWSLMDISRMAPVRVPQEWIERYGMGSKFDMEYTCRKISVPQTDPITCSSMQVTEMLLDSNHHVNNVNYAVLAMNALKEQPQIRRLRIEYQKQALLGDTITPLVYDQSTEEQYRKIIVLMLNDREPSCTLEIAGKL